MTRLPFVYLEAYVYLLVDRVLKMVLLPVPFHLTLNLRLHSNVLHFTLTAEIRGSHHKVLFKYW